MKRKCEQSQSTNRQRSGFKSLSGGRLEHSLNPPMEDRAAKVCLNNRDNRLRCLTKISKKTHSKP
uniref:Uncharacterized protein n=1 Tax=Drosophila pseudoobscura pseudoobscura TaxID=46245 RepID=A0A0R3NXS3_DROPS